jgi:hypothetical protein
MGPPDGKRTGPDTTPDPPRKHSGLAAEAKATVAQRRRTGCPCGCRTWLPWIDDPDCARHRPLPPAREWGGYDVVVLGLVPHPRETCAACQGVS